MSDQWIAFITLGSGIAAQIVLSLKIDNRLKTLERRLKTLEREIVRLETKVEERTSPKKLVLADDVGT